MQLRKSKIMLNLLIYVIVFSIIISIIGTIISYFYKNLNSVNTNLSVSSDYTMLNLYFLRTTKIKNIKIKEYGLVDEDDTSSYYITFFTEDGNNSTFIKLGNVIYFNKIKLCENVDEFKVFVSKSEKESVSLEIKIMDKMYSLNYVLN